MRPDQALRPGPQCIPLERIGEALDERERGHLARCARCQAERALWEQFDAATPDADEGAAVQWIAAELKRRRSGAPAPVRPVRWWQRLPGLVAAAATLTVAVGVGYMAWRPEPGLDGVSPTTTVYRAARLEALAPQGDVDAAPRQLAWRAVPGAARYHIALSEVDGTLLWRTTTDATLANLPPDVTARLVPAKTVTWSVTARSAGGEILAESGPLRFRVRPDAARDGDRQ